MTQYNQTSRKQDFFNKPRKIFQYFVTRFIYLPYFKIVYRLEVNGKENIPKDNMYIVASNHLSLLDPPLIGTIMNRPVAYMAKKELFDNCLLRWWLNWLGAFAVDRENLGVSTIKTALSIRKTEWILGIFPQGTRQKEGIISNVTKGFTSLAKTSKCAILPVGIIGANKSACLPFSGKIIANIGKPIPYSENTEEMYNQWIEQIQKLTGFKYEG